MKKILFCLLILGTVMISGTGCSDDVLRPTIDESTITCSLPSPLGVTVSFKAKCPGGTNVKVRFHQQTNGTEEKTIDAQYRSSIDKYIANSPALVGGSTYAYYVIGYDSNGKESSVSTEHTIDVPKHSAPIAPLVNNAKVYSPTSLVASDGYIEAFFLTKDIEYSVDEGETWTTVKEEGFIKGLRPGKVMMRVAETPTTKAGNIAYVIVPAYKSNTDLDGSEGTSEGVTSTGPKH